jgi:hypothetical protein
MAGGTEEAVERETVFEDKTTVISLPTIDFFEVITLD